MKLDDLYEELEYISLLEIQELENTDNIEQHYEDYVSNELDLTQLIKDRK